MFKKFAADSNRYVLGQLLSADVVSDAYYCPWTHIYVVLLHLPAKVIGLGHYR